MTNVSKRLGRATALGALGALCFAGTTAHAIQVKFTVENLSEQGGTWFTPVFFGFHDGSFDSFDAGSAASTSIENLAEEGNPGGLVGDIGSVSGSKAHVLFADDTAMGPPGVLFNPGASNSFTIDLNKAANRFLSVASMLLPSNDAFFGNDDPDAYELFGSDGSFNAGFVIDVLGMNVWDAGTEENDGMGAPLSTIGGTSTSTAGVITTHPGLDNLIGTGLATGTTLETAFSNSTPLARITASQVPDATPFAGLMGAAALIGFRFLSRKRNA